MRARTLVLFLTAGAAILASSSRVPAQSTSLCAVTESRGEGHWPISENAFTPERAVRALEALSAAVGATALEADFVNYETDLVYVEGYLLKRYAQQNGGGDVTSFCEFLSSEAYVRH